MFGSQAAVELALVMFSATVVLALEPESLSSPIRSLRLPRPYRHPSGCSSRAAERASPA